MINKSITPKKLIFVLGTCLMAAGLINCKPSPQPLFNLLSPDETGIHFSNELFETDSFNIFTYDYIYNGAGVAVADFNRDGRQDLFFTGNMVPNKLYLNDGKMKFTDVTDKANVNVKGRWNNGVSVVDINNDGWQDLYVCATMREDSTERGNMLFLNKGIDSDSIPHFEEVAAKYGIDDKGYSIMAAFFDYDLDGDLDLYVLTNKHSSEVSSNYRPKVNDGSSVTNDRLYRNNGNETFTNVTRQAGIQCEGFGLGLAISDLNLDGWPDIYVSNDFITNDLLYINNRNGTFTNQSPRWIGHQSQSSMGNDAADFNNDGMPDIVTMDMLPETNDRKKTSINNKSYLNYINNEAYGYEYQYMRNMLQLNNGLGDGVGFSEIGQLSGVFQTEWSWSPLFVDFDNDGLKDLVVTNGFPKDITDKDFVNFRTDVGAYVSNALLVDSVPVVKIPNYAYRNNGDLTFEDVSQKWGFTQPSFSNGAAFSDLDNDGDLEYVINNINGMAFIYENTLHRNGAPAADHYVRLKLTGKPDNINAVGAKVYVYYDHGKFQYSENQVERGYMSSVERILHFGLGAAESVDSIKIVWPDGKAQLLGDIRADKVTVVDYQPTGSTTPMGKAQPLLREVSASRKIIYRHQEDDRIDYNIQRTLPHKFSQAGPAVSAGDVNSDGLEDFVIGGSYGFSHTVFLQQKDGTFTASSGGAWGKKEEDEGMLLFDADGDADLDLYIVSGSIESEPDSKDYQDQFYRNTGAGKFVIDPQAIPVTFSSGSCVRAADIENDGDLDLFVGGRVVPGKYPYPAESYLLINDKGRFTNGTAALAPDLAMTGMVTDALFTDFDNDGSVDLLVAGEFMPLTFFKNNGGNFQKATGTGVEGYSGWWNSVAGGDFDADGDTDYIAGNLGMNNSFQVTLEYPLNVFAKDFDKNGSIDAVLACYIKETLKNRESPVHHLDRKLYPVHFWDELNSQSPRFRRQFASYKHYGGISMDKMFTSEELKDALILKANYFHTSYLENKGNGTFSIKSLPIPVQEAPVNGMTVEDIDLDGDLDVLAIGNDYGNEVFIGRYDAAHGWILLGDGKGGFELGNFGSSGFIVPGDAKALAKVSSPVGDLFVATRNRDSLKIFSRVKPDDRKVLDPSVLEWRAEVRFSDGRKQKVEFYYGAGYLSQPSRKFRIPGGASEVVIYDSKGQSRNIGVDSQ